MSSRAEIGKQIEIEKQALAQLKGKNVNVDMTRGRPSKDQLLIAMPMLQNAVNCNFEMSKNDARNYGDIQGMDCARELFARLFGVEKENVLVSDGSSLNLMYSLVQFAMQFGVLGGTPWNKLDEVKFLCPAPGYDRHFLICEQFGIKMITIPMHEDGPDMDMIERLVQSDESIKGVWCVPKYSNPTGIVYSDEVVRRFATLKPLAKDFRVYWDNAYLVHSLGNDDKLANIFDIAKSAHNEDIVYEFTSTSKITFAGSGVAALAMSQANMNDVVYRMSFKTINPNKVNQVMHVEFLKDENNIQKIMQQHASILRPKFELFDKKMRAEFADCDSVKWSKPNGGYFISLDVKNCARRVVELALDAGVKFTAAGSTFPYCKDESNSNIRIAPSVPTVEELDFAIDVLIHAIKLALAEKQA